MRFEGTRDRALRPRAAARPVVVESDGATLEVERRCPTARSDATRAPARAIGYRSGIQRRKTSAVGSVRAPPARHRAKHVQRVRPGEHEAAPASRTRYSILSRPSRARPRRASEPAFASPRVPKPTLHQVQQGFFSARACPYFLPVPLGPVGMINLPPIGAIRQEYLS
jgi:hypothetical protein